MTNEPIPICRQEIAGKERFVYEGETDVRRLLSVIVTDRGDRLPVRLDWEAIRRRVNGAENDRDTEV